MHLFLQTSIKVDRCIVPILCESVKVLVAQLCPTLCDPMDCSPPGSSVHGILQTRILERVAIPFSRGSSLPGIEPGSPTQETDSLLSQPPGKTLLYSEGKPIRHQPPPRTSWNPTFIRRGCEFRLIWVSDNDSGLRMCLKQ